MEALIFFFNEIFYRPLFNALIILYTVIPGGDFGVAIIALTLLSRLVLFPVNQKAIRSQKSLASLQPQLKKLQEEHRNNKEKQTRAVMELYRTHRINPFSGCLPLLIQLPILMALYRVFFRGIDSSHLSVLYSFVKAPESIHPFLFHIIDLSRKGSETLPGLILIALAGATQFIQAKTLLPPTSPVSGGTKSGSSREPDFAKIMQTQTTYLFPVFIVMLLWNFQTALALYFITTNIFSIFQQQLVKKPSETPAA